MCTRLTHICARSFPALPALVRLLLADNKISGGLEHLASAVPMLESLSLSGCQLPNLEALRPLAALKELQRLDVEACPLAKGEYRAAIFEMIPQLVCVDGLDKEGEPMEDDEEDDDDEDEGAFLFLKRMGVCVHAAG